MANGIPNDGFAAEVLWVGTDNAAADWHWVEVGVTDGFDGQDVYVFYTAHGRSGGIVYDERMYTSQTPAIGTQYTFSVYETVTGTSYNATIKGPSVTSTLGWGNHARPTVEWSGGLEALCLGDRVDKVYITVSQYRRNSDNVWVNASNGYMTRDNGNGGIEWCLHYTKFRYWLNSVLDPRFCS